MQKLLRQYTSASLEANHTEQHHIIAHILTIPGQALRSRRGGKKDRNREINHMRARLTDMQNIPPQSHSTSSLQSPSRPITRSMSSVNSATNAAVARCVALTREGHYRRAIKAINSTPLIDTTDPHKLLMLKSLHPQCDLSLPLVPADPPLTMVTADEHLAQAIKRMSNGSAPGSSGWTVEMLVTLTKDQDCLNGLALLLQDIINGNLPDSIKPFLLQSTLIGLDKSNGISIRPIAIGEIFYRIAATLALQTIRDAISDLLKPIQLGVGVSGGCEAIIHNLQHLLEQSDHPVAALAVDFKNAFNTISRRTVLESLYAQPTLNTLWRLADFAYSQPSELLIRDGGGNLYPGITSSQGVRQGDPLSSLLFALAIQPVYEAVVNEHIDVSASAILDDITLVGTPTELAGAYETLTREAHKIGLHIQPNKCQFIYFHDHLSPLPSAVNSFIQSYQIPYHHEAAIILGAPIGINHKAIEALATTILTDQLLVLQKLLHEAMPVQEAILLLRISSTHKLDYLLRCVPPDAMKKLAQKFDDDLLQTFTKKLDIQSQLDRPGVNKEQIISQIQLPIEKGGFGITSAKSIMNIAYVSSLAATVQSHLSFGAFSNYNDTDNKLPPDTSLYTQLDSSLKIVHQQITEDNTHTLMLPSNPHQFFAAYNHTSPVPSVNNNISPVVIRSAYSTTDLQHRLSNKAQQISYNAYLESVKDDHVCHSRILASSAPGAGTWLCASAFSLETIIPSVHYQLAARLRLGLPPKDIMPINCYSCHQYSSRSLSLVEKDEWHFMNCMEGHGGREITLRHHQVVRVVKKYAELAGAQVIVEPHHVFSESNKRPDLQIIMNHKSYLLDIAITNPTAPSNVCNGQTLLGQANAYEKIKIRKYDELAGAQHSNFIPFVIETYGGIGGKAQEFLSELSVFAHDHLTTYSHFDVVSGLRYAMACSVQRGNALIALAGYANAVRISPDYA